MRPPPNVEGARVRIGEGHSWVFVSGLWRCEHCLRMTVRPTVDAALAHEKCPGPKASLDTVTIARRGHTLAQTTGLPPILFCVKCGAWSTRRAYGLSSECRRHAAPAGRQALARIARGLQPWEDRCAETGRRRRARIGDPATAAGGGSAARGRRRRQQKPEDTQTADDSVDLVTAPTLQPTADPPDRAASVATMDDVIMNDSWHHGEEEDVFGFGGSFDQGEQRPQGDGGVVRGGTASGATSSIGNGIGIGGSDCSRLAGLDDDELLGDGGWRRFHSALEEAAGRNPWTIHG